MGDQKPAQVVGLLLGFSYCSSREGSLFPCLALQNLSWTHAKSRTSDPADRKTISLTVDRQMPAILVVFACVCIFFIPSVWDEGINQEASQGSLSVASSSSSAPALHSKRLNGDTLGPPESKGIEMSGTWFFYTFWRFFVNPWTFDSISSVPTVPVYQVPFYCVALAPGLTPALKFSCL